MKDFTIIPKVDQTQEFLEIANDFSNPLDLVREAISNSYDAKSNNIDISFDIEKIYGESILKIIIIDDGDGMDENKLQNFFDLGNSSRRDDPETIGEKGHGTKVYFNSSKIEVETSTGVVGYHAIMIDPFNKLYDREIPTVEVKSNNQIKKGTKITIFGYNKNRREKFTHANLKDYIKWFTKHGSIEPTFSESSRQVVLNLKGLDRSNFEKIEQGHFFPSESENINKLFEVHLTNAPDLYCKRVIKQGKLRNFPETFFSIIVSIEGKKIKYSYNEMLRRSGYTPPDTYSSYQIQDRYGLWICKDFIPIQKKNEWISPKGYEYTKFHAFVNCQELKLTANRSSIDNTPSEILADLEKEVNKVFEEIYNSDDWTHLSWLEDEAQAHRSSEKEKNNLKWRIKKINKSLICNHEGLVLVEPERESGVYSIFLILSSKYRDLFPFQIIDYDTHEGIDVIAKADKNTPISKSALHYVEFKRYLSNNFNHSFENIFSIVCWESKIKQGEIIKDINSEERIMKIVSREDDGEYTRYFLDNPRKAHKIEVFCLKTYLKEKLGIEFTQRNLDTEY